MKKYKSSFLKLHVDSCCLKLVLKCVLKPLYIYSFTWPMIVASVTRLILLCRHKSKEKCTSLNSFLFSTIFFHLLQFENTYIKRLLLRFTTFKIYLKYMFIIFFSFIIVHIVIYFNNIIFLYYKK